jgi:hypothetical protein
MEIQLNFTKGEPVTHLININSKSTIFEVKTKSDPILIEFDPNSWLLASINEK